MFFCYKILVYRFADKTRNDWSARQKFVKHAGKYDMVAIDYNAQVCWSAVWHYVMYRHSYVPNRAYWALPLKF